ncbi:M20/M25/M40 family metallo-hydrolase [Alicyclobacillus dauci]|uniref:M20/M25/M40 family metallo-hydrolase n=1 Tax=Alicyclobacillus dauci TaxID=1475485 RepID=A0ABY6Z2D8_9BACL|nr:M20/M25/M40 family metallo-hydrolase [Alicyclobacillus dauci]WAH36909.1 M20/M25/M40 family metallo-hydrolase [Alicyclobacillus dauci]
MTFESNMTWSPQDEAGLRDAIQLLARIPSITGTAPENEVSKYLADRLRGLASPTPSSLVVEQFVAPDTLQAGVAALYLKPGCKRTVVMLAHTDVVSVDDFGPYHQEAFDIPNWTHRLRSGEVDLPAEASFDLQRGEWWFGRGVMDMKAGLALNLVLFEKACREGAAGNLVFLAVPDEESHSRGMLAATELLRRWQETYGLEYALCLNTEPSFVGSNERTGWHVYSGSFGKMLLGALAIGIPGHVGIPFSGVSAVQMVTHLAQTLEANPDLSERTDSGGIVPLTCLWLRDLQETYSVQSPHMAAAFFHVPFFRKSPSQVLSSLGAICQEAMGRLRDWTADRARQAGMPTPKHTDHIPVVWLSELMRTSTHSALRVDPDNLMLGTLDAVRRIALSHRTAAQAQVVLFLAPPVYPAVDAADDPLVQRCIHQAQKRASETFGLDLEHRTAFPGLCDLSYTGYGLGTDFAAIAREMPVWGNGYSLPLQTMADLAIPVCNLGPFGKDAHQWTERLDVEYTTRVLPLLSLEVLSEALRTDVG